VVIGEPRLVLDLDLEQRRRVPARLPAVDVRDGHRDLAVGELGPGLQRREAELHGRVRDVGQLPLELDEPRVELGTDLEHRVARDDVVAGLGEAREPGVGHALRPGAVQGVDAVVGEDRLTHRLELGEEHVRVERLGRREHRARARLGLREAALRRLAGDRLGALVRWAPERELVLGAGGGRERGDVDDVRVVDLRGLHRVVAHVVGRDAEAELLGVLAGTSLQAQVHGRAHLVDLGAGLQRRVLEAERVHARRDVLLQRDVLVDRVAHVAHRLDLGEERVDGALGRGAGRRRGAARRRVAVGSGAGRERSGRRERCRRERPS
jgi:hypothetical protein